MANRPIPCLIHSSQTTSRNKSGFFNFFSVESSIRYTLLLFGVFFTFWIACFIFLLVEVPVDFLFSNKRPVDQVSVRAASVSLSTEHTPSRSTRSPLVLFSPTFLFRFS